MSATPVGPNPPLNTQRLVKLPLAKIVMTDTALTNPLYNRWHAVLPPHHRPLTHVMIQGVVDHANLAMASLFGVQALRYKACPELLLNLVHFGHRTKHFSFTE